MSPPHGGMDRGRIIPVDNEGVGNGWPGGPGPRVNMSGIKHIDVTGSNGGEMLEEKKPNDGFI